MTMATPSQEEIAAAAAELGADDLELIEPAELKEPASSSADSGTLSLDGPATGEAQDTYSMRQTEPFRRFDADDQQQGEDKDRQWKKQ
jgi:hypothetical protein